MPESEYKKLYENSTKEIERLTTMLTEMQKNLQSALDGNNDLREQLKSVQAKLDVLLAKKKNRDRKDFDSKKEGRTNPRPALADRQRNEPEQDEDITDSPSNSPEIVEHNVPEEARVCPHCNIETQFVGTTVTKQLESLLHSLKWYEHRQETRSCPKCKTYITKAPKPSLPIPGGYAGPILLATIVTDKVEDGLPNYRQEKRYARQSFSVPRSTQCDWFIALSLTVLPLYELINREILKSAIVQTDETQLKVQDRELAKNMRKAKMFVVRGDADHKLVSLVYSPDLTFAKNKEFFRGFSGVIQADAAGGFDALFQKDEAGNEATEAGCHAHARRRIFDALAMETDIATRMLSIYEEIYKIEKRARRKSAEYRLALRRRYTKPLIRELRSLHLRNQRNFPPSHLLAEAAKYALRNWKALTRFLKNPQIEIDNNASEREVKSFVLSRKNFLFSGSDAGAKALAIHSTLIASAKRNKLNPIEYLADVFARINDMKLSDLSQLLPDRWTKLN